MQSASVTSRTSQNSTQALASSFSGDTVNLQAGQNLAITGSSVVSTNATQLTAGGSITIAAATETAAQSSLHEEQRSGLSLGGMSSSASKDSYDATAITQSQSGSAVGSLNGNVNITAGKDITVQGSSVVGLTNVALTATNGNVAIVSSQDSSQISSSHEQSASSFSLGYSAGVASTGYSKASASNQASSSTLTQQSSTIAAANGNAQIQAGQALSVVASDISAGQNLTLIGQSIDLSAAQNTSVQQGTQQSSASGFSVGVTVNPVAAFQHSGSANSTTYATLTDGNIKIGGQSMTSAASLGAHTDLATANSSIEALPDVKKLMQDQQAMAAAANTVVTTSVQVAGDIASSRAKAAQASGDTEAAQNWSPTGDYTRALKTIAGVLVGGLAGQSAGQLAAGASAPYLANAIGDYFSQPGNENKTAQVLSHAVLGALLAAANGGSAAGGAAAGAGGELAAEAITKELYPKAYDADGSFHPDRLSASEANTVVALSSAVGAMLGGVTGGTTQNALIGANVAANAATNNYLTHSTMNIVKSCLLGLTCSSDEEKKEMIANAEAKSKELDAEMKSLCSDNSGSDACKSAVNAAT